MTREEVFFENMQIDEEDKPRVARAIYSKGIEKHILIKEALLSWHKKAEIKYSEVATVYRYDKRIRNILFKYISYIEEFYRGFVLDNFYSDTKQRFWLPIIKTKLNDGIDLNDILESIHFSELVEQVKILPPNIKGQILFVKKHENENLRALNGLRNAVMHNKFLLLFLDFEDCYLDNRQEDKVTDEKEPPIEIEPDAGLRSNIINMINFLPEAVRVRCINELNDCRKAGDNKDKTRWNLPMKFVVIL
jgi:hypothetical protein